MMQNIDIKKKPNHFGHRLWPNEALQSHLSVLLLAVAKKLPQPATPHAVTNGGFPG